MTEIRTPLTHARPTMDGRIAVRATSEERALIARASEITSVRYLEDYPATMLFRQRDGAQQR